MRPEPILVGKPSETHRMFNGLLREQQRVDGPILQELDKPVELTFGQVKLLHERGITLLMSDDLGKYELTPGPGNKVVKSRL